MTKTKSSLGRLQGELAEPIESIPSELLVLINKNCQPPEELTAEDVHVRAMYIVSDEVNSYGGRFPHDEHDRLVELLIDSPVLVGHRQDKLPVGRNFHAKLVERNGKNWIKCFFYWLKKAEGSVSLQKNIDGGICKECSISFTFRMPECSLCNKDIRLCAHEPFEKYPALADEPCYFNYRQIEKVLETSLVYRGAIPDTRISKELAERVTDQIATLPPELKPIASLDELADSSNYLIIPRYDSLAVTIRQTDKKLQLLDKTGQTIEPIQLAYKAAGNSCELDGCQARLVGYRGKERCSEKSIRAFLNDQPTTVNRLALLLLPTDVSMPTVKSISSSDLAIKMMPHRFAKRAAIDLQARQIMTRDGVELWPLVNGSLSSSGYAYRASGEIKKTIRPDAVAANSILKNSYQFLSGAKNQISLRLNHDRLPAQVELKDFSFEQVTNGRRFLADFVSEPLSETANNRIEKSLGKITNLSKKGESWLFQLGGKLAGIYCLCPIRLNGHDRQLFYRLRARTI